MKINSAPLLAALTPRDASYTWDLACKVVVGEAFEHATHVLTGKVDTVVFRPFWNVPASIVKHDILPALRKHPHYQEAGPQGSPGDRLGWDRSGYLG